MRKTRSKETSIPMECSKSSPRKVPETAEEYENVCINLSYKLVEQRLREGTASSQETTHFLKLGSSKEKREREAQDIQNQLNLAKRDQLRSMDEMKELLANAITAFTDYKYQGASE